MDEHSACPMHAQHASHHDMVNQHGDAAMGFPHDKTTHHFSLSSGGGAIQVTANDPRDGANIQAIQAHLSHIASLFTEGDFSVPMLVHDGTPPGTTTMKLLKDRIVYRYEAVGTGGRVSIQSTDPIALAAIHDFLRFQITEHATGDPVALDAAQ